MAQLPLEMMAACRANLPDNHPWRNGHRSAEDVIERYRLGALATGLHNLLSGATSLIDMIALPDADDNGEDEMAFLCLAAAAKGYRQSGVRIYLGRVRVFLCPFRPVLPASHLRFRFCLSADFLLEVRKK